MKRTRRLGWIVMTLAVTALAVISLPSWESVRPTGFTTQAMPAWSRKYNADCSLCHTTYPRLNRKGYEFKRLGYRFPNELVAKGKGTTQTPVTSAQASHLPFVVAPTGYKPKAATAESQQGRALYEKLNCAACHSIGGTGANTGPPLDGVGGRRGVKFLIDHLTDPETHAKLFPELHGGTPNRMPRPQASAEEVKSIVAYLLTLPEPAAGFLVNPHIHPSNLPTAVPSSATYTPAPVTASSQAGEKLYFDTGCAACHAINKVGGQLGPPVDGIGARRSREFIVAHITNPQLHTEQFPGQHASKTSEMPPTEATREQIEQMADYLLTLPGGQEVGTPKSRLQDYFAVSYIPAVEFENEAGTTTTTFDKRELVVYAAGPIGRNFSFFVQPLPLSQEKGFLGKFEMMQGLLNFGGAQNFTQVRVGQIFNLRNAGFGGTDRGLTDSLPFIFQPVNGFNPSGLGRGASVEYTVGRSTTFKVFANSNEKVEVASDEPPIPELSRSRTYGFAYEQVLGQRGLSGVQFQFAGGSTPFFLDELKQPSLRFQRYSFFANKTFQDRKNFERVNAIFGLSFLRDSRFLGVDVEQRSRGYGYFVEVDTVPVVKHLSVFGRYDQLRPTTLISGNTLRGGTFGVLFDPVKYARVSFEYQHLAGLQTLNRYRVGLQFNY
jgi:mono/diheme cytochrome c family protein